MELTVHWKLEFFTILSDFLKFGNPKCLGVFEIRQPNGGYSDFFIAIAILSTWNYLSPLGSTETWVFRKVLKIQKNHSEISNHPIDTEILSTGVP